MFRTSSSAVHGPGDFTLTAVVVFTLGSYGVAAGAVTGDQTVVAIGVFAFSMFAVGVVWPIVTLARVRIDIAAPPDATVGDEVALHVTLRGKAARIEVRVLDPPSRWWRTPVPAGGTLPHLATRRGVFEHVRVQIRTAAPLGIFVRVRQARVLLPDAIAIAPRPRPAAAHLHPVPDDVALDHHVASAAGSSDVVRAVRPYVAGDPARLVHWPTSARRGELVVREHDPPGAHGVALVVDLSGPQEWADEAAARAAGLARSTLAGGGVVVLATCERQGPVCAPVDSAREVGRRLALAVGGRPAMAPPGWPVQTVRAADVGFPE